MGGKGRGVLPLIHLNPFKWRMLIRFDYIIFNPNRHGPVEGFSQRMLGRDAPDSAGDAGCSGRILLLSHGIIRVGSGCAGRIAGGGGEGGESVGGVGGVGGVHGVVFSRRLAPGVEQLARLET